ncbi:MAG: hypothetical protein IAF02_04635 [Anaerolineae bacterium]|nr:hypothetical protein [Anaerolineae bacterium]
MEPLPVDVAFLQEFEQGLNPSKPEQSKIPAQVLGYGEISTVFSIDAGDGQLAYKRIPSFKNMAEATDYVTLYNDCMAVFAEIGLDMVPGKMVAFAGVNGRYTVIYLVQKKLDPLTIANKAIHQLDAAQAIALITGIFDEFDKVFAFNAQNQGKIEVGFDGQLSNWAVTEFAAENGNLPEPLNLVYFDTSSPLLRRNGVEQLDAEIFLRNAPSFLAWLLRVFYLDEVVTRYYDLRKVTIDLLANLYKEQKAELVPDLLKIANERWAHFDKLSDRDFDKLSDPTFDKLSDRNKLSKPDFPPITLQEIESYYREDAFIWRFYLSARRFDRWLHHLLRKPYPYILPGNIKR